MRPTWAGKESGMSGQTTCDDSTKTRPTARENINRVLVALLLLAVVLGVGLGQHVITWLNATLL